MRIYEVQIHAYPIQGFIFMVLDEAVLQELGDVQAQLALLLPKLTKWKVEELQHQISHHYTKTWTHRKTPKYGSVRKDFSQAELERFLSVGMREKGILSVFSK